MISQHAITRVVEPHDAAKEITMGKLRQKMINDMIVRGFADRTRESYLRVVVGLVRYYRRPPDKLTDEQVQAYIAYLYKDRQLSWSSCSVAAHGLRFFYHTTLGRDRSEFVVPAPHQPSRLPEILSVEEVVRIFDAAASRKQRVLLMTTYAAGLRVSEVVGLRLSDIDSNRHAIRVEQGKGMRDRYTLLSERLLLELRAYWREYRPDPWLFPARESHSPMSVTTAQRIYGRAKRRARIAKRGGIHALRHAFATHMLEGGTDLHTIQRLMGHRYVTSTVRYLHVARTTLVTNRSPLDLLKIPPSTS